LTYVEPPQVFDSQLSEAHATPTTLVGIPLEQRLFGIVLAHQRQHPLGRLGLGQCTVG
jgi:hypothetical protein